MASAPSASRPMLARSNTNSHAHKTNSVPTSTLPLNQDVGKPVASLPTNSFTLRQTSQLESLLTIIRDVNTQRGEFIFYSDRIIRLLVEEGLNHLPVVDKAVQTPTGATYNGVGFCGKIAGVSIMRAGEAFEAGLRECAR